MRSSLARVALALVAFAVGRLIEGQTLPTATLSGTVTSADGLGFPGATVSIESESLQGTRRATTSATGGFLFAFLPPGDYVMTFEALGMRTVFRRIALNAAGMVRVAQTLEVAPVTESVAVETGPAGAISGPTISASLEKETTDRLPVDRSLRTIVLLAPGVTENGPRASTGSANERRALMISGAPSYSNLFLVNGVVVNENLRGQPQDLFIEDAIEETTVSTGSLSAEYGRYTGGVVNVLTKSGGNRLRGSLRVTFRNDRWTANNPYDRGVGLDHRVNDVTHGFEETLGGPFWRDRFWFFAAGRQEELSDSRETRPTSRPGDVDPTPIPYLHATDEKRLEAKFTLTATRRLTFVASYIDGRVRESNFAFSQNILDVASLVPREAPHSLLALNSSGVLSDRFFVETQYSRRRFSIEAGEPVDSDPVRGTRIFDRLRANAGYHSPQAPNRNPHRFDNDSWSAKATYYLPTRTFGSHEIRAGYERFSETARANYYFSGSDFWILEPAGIIRGTEVFPSFRPGLTTIQWNPVLERSRGSELVTDSVFLEDRLQLGLRWNFQLGLRYDRNRDRDSGAVLVSESDSWSPRLAFRFDPGGTGRFDIHGGYARYVDKLHDSIASAASPAGFASRFNWIYAGPCVNCNPLAPTSDLIDANEALGILFDWFFSMGGTASRPTAGATLPGVSTRIASDLRPPGVREYSIGVGQVLLPHGFLRADFLHRDFRDLYSSRIDLSTGQSPPDAFGNVHDMAVIGNSNRLNRRYTAVQSQLSWRLGKSLQVGGGYTWSRLTGNVVGENRTSAMPADIEQYPQYREERWNHPTGYLSSRGLVGQAAADQRHRAKLWVAYDFRPRWGTASAAILESLDSGLPYEAVGPVDPRRYAANPGYQQPPTSVLYFFTKPGAFRTDDVTRTDFAINATIRVFRDLELFVRPEVLNLFNEKAVVAVDTTVQTAANQTGFQAFDPFTATPVRGPRDVSNPTANYDFGPDFGRATGPDSYQTPRTFRVSAGLRF